MTEFKIFGVSNLHDVDGFVWRSAQPADSAWPLLRAAGCRAVLDLNTIGCEDSLRQATLVRAAGMQYLPLAWNEFLAPTQAQIQVALAWLDAHVNDEAVPVLVHCAHGSDRTGVLCACWRMHKDGWTFQRARHEAFFGLGPQGMHEFWMMGAVAEFAVRNLKHEEPASV